MPYDVVIIFGGDGTVHRNLPALMGTDVPLLVVPVGSGNDFAAALGLDALHTAIAAWQKFLAGGQNVSKIDLGTIATPGAAVPNNPIYYCCIAGVGLDSETNRRANSLPWWMRAHGGYVLSAVISIFLYRPRVVRVSVGERTISKPATLVAFANAPAYGRGMRIAPRAQLDDGLLDLCFVERVAAWRLLWLFPRVFSGAHLAMDEVEYVQTNQLRVDSECPMAVFADGEFVAETPIEVGIVSRALTVIVP